MHQLRFPHSRRVRPDRFGLMDNRFGSLGPTCYPITRKVGRCTRAGLQVMDAFNGAGLLRYRIRNIIRNKNGFGTLPVITSLYLPPLFPLKREGSGGQ